MTISASPTSAPPPEISAARHAEVHRAAATYYADTLASRHGVGPREYLGSRGLGWAAGIAAPGPSGWVVGYAPPGWTALVGELRGRGYTDTELLAAGLAVTTRRGTIVDRFRDRIMLGLRETEVTLVGFIGRASPGASREVPKYLNSPRTPAFDKSRVLFGLAEQHRHLACGAIPVLVEGPLDVLAVAARHPSPSDGDTLAYAAVAPCGTALTRGHVAALGSVVGHGAVDAREVVVAFDADPAGRRAARAAYPLLSPTFAIVRGVALPPDEDPASLAVAAPTHLTSALETAGLLVDRLVDDVIDGYGPRLDNAELRVLTLRDAMSLVAGLPPHEVSRQVARVATRLGFPVSLATSELTEAVTRHRPREAPAPTGDVHPRRRDHSTPTPQPPDFPNAPPSRTAPRWKCSAE